MAQPPLTLVTLVLTVMLFTVAVVIRAAELMLDRFDRRISDRYKMIDYREEDNAKKVDYEDNWIIQVTLPVALGEYIAPDQIQITKLRS